MNRLWLAAAVCVLLSASAQAGGRDEKVAARLAREAWVAKSRLVPSAIGVTRQGTSLPCWIDTAELADEPTRMHVWLVGGLDGSDKSVDSTISLSRWFQTSPEAEPLRKKYAVSAVVIANPDGWALGLGDKNGSEGQPTRGYPPAPDGYQSSTNPEAQYVWRWLGTQAADFVVEVRAATAGESVGMIPGTQVRDGDSLAVQLTKSPAANMGLIPASRLVVTGNVDQETNLLRESLQTVATNCQLQAAKPSDLGACSAARRERRQRIGRSPSEVATQLGRRYGHSLKSVQYIPAVAVIGRLRMIPLESPGPQTVVVPDDIAKIIEPYRFGKQRALSDKPSGSDLAGHLLFGELALRSRDPALIALVQAAADLGFDDQGQPRAAMPFHSEMSDAVFMACPLLAQAGRLTGDAKYHDMLARHLAFMQKLCLRKDGLYRHSPLDEAAWGRGNGFPALGLAWALDNLPKEHSSHAVVLRAFQNHLTALRTHQDPTGMWHQVIDHAGSYRELTATSMISYAMLRGMRMGWLDRAAFEPSVRKAWPALAARIAADGSLIDVCEGTGKQPNLRAYFDRKAILGPDDRGGAMALLVATEMMQWEAASARK